MPATEQRQSIRLKAPGPVQVRLPNGVLLEGQTRDISLRGLWLATDQCLPLRARAHVRIGGRRALPVELEAQVNRADEGGVAMVFTRVSEDNCERLRSLMQPAAAITS
jgi:hypothetical protein